MLTEFAAVKHKDTKNHKEQNGVSVVVPRVLRISEVLMEL